MNARQLEKLGIPRHAVNHAIRAIRSLSESPDFDKRTIKDRLRLVAENPKLFLGDALLDASRRSRNPMPRRSMIQSDTAHGKQT